MSGRTYSPRRASAQWLQGAPSYVLDVWDNGGRTADRYTVFLYGQGHGFPGDNPGTARVEYLAMSGDPTSPQGFSQFGEMTAGQRAGFAYARTAGNRRIRWLDLPAHIQAHVIARCDPGEALRAARGRAAA